MIAARLHRHRVARLAVALIAVIALTGCAARRSSFAERFVKPGEPSATYDVSPMGAPQESLTDYARRLRNLQAMPRTKATLLPTIESTHRGLAAALGALALNSSPENHRLVAEAYLDAGVRDYAYRHFQRALKLDPCDSAAHEGVARLWRDWGMADLALGDAYRAIHCRPHSPSAHNTLGTILLALGQRVNARRAFEFALMLDKGAAFAHNNLCYVALADGDGGAAERHCTRALALAPSMRAAETNLALAYAMQGEIARAERRLLSAPDPATGQYNVGILRMSLGHYTEAAAAFQSALSTRPSLADAARRAVRARQLAAAHEAH